MFTAWDEVFYLADELSKRSSEACFRSAINRAYYAAFHLSLSYGQFNRIYSRVRGRDDHSEIINVMKRQSNSVLRNVGINLDRLKAQRTEADYMENIPISQSSANLAVQRARNLINNLNTLSGISLLR